MSGGGIFTEKYYKTVAVQVRCSGAVMLGRVPRVAKSSCWIRHAVRLSVAQGISMGGLLELPSGTSMKICWQNSNLVISGQKYRTLYVEICGPG